MKRKYETQITNHRSRTDRGSVLILTVILTSLLAVIGVMFMMVARVDKISTSAIIENKELNLAVDSVIAKISEQLILDTPGIVEPNQPMPEYYDYPDSANPWLASLEPVFVSDNETPLITTDDIYHWQRISDIYDGIDPTTGFKKGLLESWVSLGLLDDYDRPVGPGDLIALPVSPSEEVEGIHLPDSSINFCDFGGPADADGDGVADSRWIQLPDATGSRGEPIFVAVRIIDNSAMLNVNTMYANLGGGDERKGDMLTDIYIDGLIKSSPTEDVAKATFLNNRSDAPDASTYYWEGAIRIENPDTTTEYFYTFYDISEELSLRNRFILYPYQTNTRLEAGSRNDPNRCLSTTLRASIYGNAYTPYTLSDFGDWKRRFNPYDLGAYGSEPNENNYDFRHLLSTCNMDRIIDPNGNKMLNVNTADAYDIYNKLLAIRDADPNNFMISDAEAAQIAVNIKDYSDGNDPNLPPALYDPDNNVSSLFGTYYGFERPCVYISEVAHRFTREPLSGDTFRSYAVELYKPYSTDADPNGWQLVVEGVGGRVTIPITWSGDRQYHVLRNQDPGAVFNKPINNPIDSGATIQDTAALVFDVGSSILLQRFVRDAGVYITVDSERLPSPGNGWLQETADVNSYQRDISLHKCISGLWDDTSLDISLNSVDDPTLGRANSYVDGVNTQEIQAHPANTGFTSIGDIGKIFYRNVYIDDANTITGPLDENNIRVNLANTTFQKLFKYLTVFDPSNDFIDNDGDGLGIDGNGDGQLDVSEVDWDELKIPGRININTAPWYVIAQLPWVSRRINEPTTNELARAIVDHRNTNGAFESIGELNRVGIGDPNNYRSMDFYSLDFIDLDGFPDLTPDDGVEDDFEERDVIFSRISNLVTVRSDVFTAYILVRIGTDGPQKRVIAILDRSDVYSPADKVKIVALHPVPDPR